jgi:hypothetical protein
VRLREVRGVGTPLLTAGVLRHSALGSEAVYRVLHRRGSTVEVVVIAAPGLEPGARLVLTAAAAASMGLDTAGAGPYPHRVRSAARAARRAARGTRDALGYLTRQVPACTAPIDRAG